MFDLYGNTIVVSGAASGIGFAIAEHLLEVGARAILLDIDEEGLRAAAMSLSQSGVEPFCVLCDVTSSEQLDNAFQSIEKKFGPIDGAVANAGIRTFGLSTELTQDEWKRVIDVNLNGVFYFSARAARSCLTRGAGSIVTISSVAAFGGLPERANYCAAKAGVVNLTKVLALELAPRKVRVNSVAPGSVETPMAAQNTQEQRRKMIASTPMGRLGDPREISNVVLFLLSNYSTYITGETILVDGGWSASLM